MCPIEIFQPTLARLVAVLSRFGIRFHLTGGITAVAYGEPHMTQDLDLVIDQALKLGLYPEAASPGELARSVAVQVDLGPNGNPQEPPGPEEHPAERQRGGVRGRPANRDEHGLLDQLEGILAEPEELA